MLPRTPEFWYHAGSIGSRLAVLFLWPLSLAYRLGHTLHQATASPYKAPHCKVICAGNLTAGGSGKTPVALALMKILRADRAVTSPAFLSRGYGGREEGPLFVDTDKHRFEDTGDEPLLLARHGPVIISANRAKGARYADKHDILIMDDGFQNTDLVKDLSFLVIDGATGFGNGRLLPAGPLREPLSSGLAKADAFILIGEDRTGLSTLLPPEKPLFRAHLKVPQSWIADSATPYIGFTGLGQPAKFRRTLEQKGLNLAGWYEFPDHYPYTVADIQKLDGLALAQKARLITTEKDAVRLPESCKTESPLDILPVEISWDDINALKNFLGSRLK